MKKIVREWYKCEYCDLECQDSAVIEEHEKKCSQRLVDEFKKKNNFRVMANCTTCKNFFDGYKDNVHHTLECNLCNLDGTEGRAKLITDGFFGTPSPRECICDRYEEWVITE